MTEPDIKRPTYAVFAALPVGVVLFIGGIIAIVAKQVTLGGVLIVLGLVALAICVVLLLVVRSRTRVIVGDLRTKQESDMAKLLREHPELRDQPEFRNFPGGNQQP